MKLELPYPPSVNHYYKRTRTGKIYISIEGKRYRDLVIREIMIRKPVRFGKQKVKIEGIIFTPDKRKRDGDNIKKCLFDSLEAAAIFDDDSQIFHEDFKKIVGEPPGRVILKITPFFDDGVRDLEE